jgi:uncharacterized caspase-like protein
MRVALVIGDSAYRRTAKLKNLGNDAADMAQSLKSLGLRGIEGLDLDKASMDARIRQFAQALAGAESGVFFYAGHGGGWADLSDADRRRALEHRRARPRDG